MIKKKYILIALLSFFALSNPTYASCTYDDEIKFKKIESEYETNYNFNEETLKYNVTIKYPNTKDYNLKIEEELLKYVKNIKNNVIELINVEPGEYSIEILGTTKECNDVLKEIKLKLYYNKYYKDPLCEGIEEFVLCKKEYNKTIDYDTFKKRIELYKKEKEQQKNNNEVQKNERNKAIEYIKENKTIIATSTIGLIMLAIIIIVITKKERKRRNLE